MDKDRRSAKRIKVRVSACCLENTDSGSKSGDLPVHTKDISSRGAHLIVSKKLNKHEKFLIGFNLPALCNPLSFQCEVIWSRKCEDMEAHYETGIRFLKTDPYDIGRLERFLRLRDVYTKEPVCQG